ncbi:Uncharacterised protein [uncultured archaeon]|nr:Uncharacterised protein [uncultured archaeon]
MNEHHAGPYDADKCYFCGKSGEKNGGKHTAGYQRREEYAQLGPWRDSCQSCAEKPYKQPEQFKEGVAVA